MSDDEIYVKIWDGWANPTVVNLKSNEDNVRRRLQTKSHVLYS